jgi:glutamate/tyrosine decarboxylase-like PLP-dependent enzyme
VSRRFLYGNALNPLRFPHLAALESEVIDWVAALLHRPADGGPAGSMSSGGTESIVLSMLVHRERARARGVARPQIVASEAAHPAYAKAAHYLGMDIDLVALDNRYRTDPEAVRAAMNDRTCVIVASAFSYPYGVMDDVPTLASIASEAGAGCHVDACIGAFILPFLEKLGIEVPPFDFRVPGVTAISADIHKYGYVPKGASVVLHRDADWAMHQTFLYDRWGAGLYGSRGIAGARPAAPVACSWAVLNYLGVEGYTSIVAGLAELTTSVRAAVNAIPAIAIVGDPTGPVLAIESDEIDLYAVSETMEQRGWYLNRLTKPRGLHMMLAPAHATVSSQLLADLADAVAARGVARNVGTNYA